MRIPGPVGIEGDGPATSLADLEALAEHAREVGADRAAWLPAARVAVDERARLKCLSPRCRHYGRCPTCPPAVPSVTEFSAAVARYRAAILVQVDVPVPDDILVLLGETTNSADRSRVYGRSDFRRWYHGEAARGANRLVRTVLRVHDRLRPHDQFVLPLAAGHCQLCRTEDGENRCVGAASGKPCRRWGEAMPAMEALGIDVLATAANAGLPFSPSVVEKIVWNGLVLFGTRRKKARGPRPRDAALEFARRAGRGSARSA